MQEIENIFPVAIFGIAHPVEQGKAAVPDLLHNKVTITNQVSRPDDGNFLVCPMLLRIPSWRGFKRRITGLANNSGIAVFMSAEHTLYGHVVTVCRWFDNYTKYLRFFYASKLLRPVWRNGTPGWHPHVVPSY